MLGASVLPSSEEPQFRPSAKCLYVFVRQSLTEIVSLFDQLVEAFYKDVPSELVELFHLLPYFRRIPKGMKLFQQSKDFQGVTFVSKLVEFKEVCIHHLFSHLYNSRRK